MLQAVTQTSEVMADTCRQVVAIIGDEHEALTGRLVDAVGNQSTTTLLHLDTKYYQADVGVRQFRGGRELLKAVKQEPELVVGAIIMRLSTKNELEVMEDILHKVNCETHVLVVDSCSPDLLNFAQSWAHSYRFELVILNPDQSQREEAKSLCEKCGIDRVAEIIESVGWQLKKDNFKKITGKEGLDRLLAIIDAMSESSEDSDVEPDEEDKEAIWQAFSSSTIPSQSTETSSSSTSKERVCEASVSVDVNIVKKERTSEQWFSGLLDKKVKELSNDVTENAEFNSFVQAMRDTRDVNMKLTDPAKRADNAAALLSKFVDLNIKGKGIADTHSKKD